ATATITAIYFSDPSLLYLHHFCIISYIIFVMTRFQCEPFHPAVWLTPFLYIYHGSTCVYHLLGIEVARYPEEVTLCVWLAVATVGNFSILFCRQNNVRYDTNAMPVGSIPLRVLQSLYVLFFFIFTLDLAQFLISGASSKIDIVLFDLRGINLSFSHSLLILTYTILLSYYTFVRRRYPIQLTALTLFALSLGVLILGERDILLRPLAISLLAYSVHRKSAKWVVLPLGAFALVSVPFLGALKSYFTLGFRLSHENEFLFSPFYGEFLRVGKNLEVILHRMDMWDYFYGETLLWDFARGLIPGFLYVPTNPTSWFNDLFFGALREEGGANGFSLLAEGYINFGYTGIVLWYSALSLFVHTFFRYSRRSVLALACYLYMVPFMIHVQRADFSNLISPLWKQLLLPITALMIGVSFHKALMRRRKKATNRSQDKIGALRARAVR
ncbi:MAG: oligosaccharide repeat unit polymerase, partial [Bdellovibrionales bacterium]|nr:oligosaccharide repeat unit polymerase [Bdellovibrionales bacterium]